MCIRDRLAVGCDWWLREKDNGGLLVWWNKTKSKVRGAVKNIAKELVELYAVRQEKEGYVCGPDTVWQREFEEMFPYEELSLIHISGTDF